MNDASQPYTAPALLPGDTRRGALLGFAVLLGACAFSFDFTSFLHAKDAALAIGLLAVSLLWMYERRSPWPGIQAFAPLWALLIFSLLIHVGFGLAEVPAFTLETCARIATVLLLAAYAFDFIGGSELRGRWVVLSVAASGVLVAMLGVLQYAGPAEWLFPSYPEYGQRMYSVFGNQGLFGGYVALSVPLAVAGYFSGGKRAHWALLALVILLAALLLSASRSAWLAAAIGTLLVVPLRRITPRRGLLLCGLTVATVAIVSMAAPDATLRRFAVSFSTSDVGYNARLWFWDASLGMLRDAPLAGVGPGNFQYWSPSYQGDVLQTAQGHESYRNDLHTLHAHSDLLEITTETGAIGVALMAWMLWRLRKGRGAEWGGLAAYLTFGALNSTLHSAPHMLAALLFACVLLGRSRPPSPDKPLASVNAARLRRWLPVWAALGLLIFTFSAIVVPSHRLNSARAAYEANDPAAENLYVQALRSPWPAYEAAEEWAVALFEQNRVSEIAEFVEHAARGRDTWTVHYLSGALADNRNDPDAALDAYRASLRRWPEFLPAWRAALELTSQDDRSALLGEARKWLSPELFAELQATKKNFNTEAQRTLRSF